MYLRFTLADLPGSTTYIKNNLNHLAHADVGLLVVSPELGVDKNTRLFYHLANHFGVKMIVPVITTRPDTDEETLDLVKMELSELEDIRDSEVLGVQDLNKFLEKLENQIDNTSIISSRDSEKPFFMALEQVLLLLFIIRKYKTLVFFRLAIFQVEVCSVREEFYKEP